MTLISSRSNPHIQYWKSLLTDNKARKTEGKIVIEGRNLVEELLKKSLVEELIVTEKWSHLQGANRTFILSDTAYRGLSQLDQPEGVAALVALPKTKPLNEARKILILDRLQDPGNVGTLLRTSCAFDIDHVVFLLPSCDPWNEKVVRAGKGAHFTIPVSTCTIEELESWKNETNGTIYIADLEGDSSEILRNHSGAFGIVLSNEAAGPDARLLPFGRRVTITMNGRMESLNVAQAGAILLYLINCKTV